MVDPVGGVGGVQDTVIFLGSVRGVADTDEGAVASVEEDMQKQYCLSVIYSIALLSTR